MKNANFYGYAFILCVGLVIFIACKGNDTSRAKIATVSNVSPVPEQRKDAQISEYIRNIYQDKNGGLWMGTNGYGVAHYDGKSVSYYSNAEGFGGQQITGISEDLQQNIWFATDQGIVKYDWSTNKQGEKQFVNFSGQQFGGKQFWSIYADSKGVIWAGAATGIYRFDGMIWMPFQLPLNEGKPDKFISKNTSWSITEDKKGNIWFSTNGFGAFKYDGQSFTQYSKKDGLADDSVDDILEDSKGNMWFGTRFGGVSRYDGKTFTNYTSMDSIGDNEVCDIYEDSAGNIWFSSEGYGVYKFDGASFTNYRKEQGLGVRAVQTIFEDQKGRLWVGGGGGLYRLEDGTFVNVKKNGPWD